MATKKVIYFTASFNPTSDELADIAQLNAAAVPQYEVLVVNASANTKYGEGDRIIPADFVAGKIPDAYFVDGDLVYPEIDPWAIPNQALAETQAIVEDGQVLEVDGGGTVTLTIADGVIAGVVYDAG